MAMCDMAGNGCCANDSYPQYKNRKGGQPSGPYQAINQSGNMPSRTAVDLDGNMWIANRAFTGQSSVTKIANDPSECIDRNGNGKIDTSTDVNGNGVIEVDCNGNGMPDNIKDVQGTPCKNGLAQEFYGEDDECILFTTNTGNPQQYGRPLSLGPGAMDFGPSDAWPGTFMDGKFFRVDGTTGMTKDDVQLLAGCHGWAGHLGPGPLCYFNTKMTSQVGNAPMSNVGTVGGYGIALDRDQNIWLASCSSGVCRYTPDRTNGFTNLGLGHWTFMSTTSVLGIAVDSRSPNNYFAWGSGSGVVVKIPASTIPPPQNMDLLVDGTMWQSIPIAGNAKGVGVDRDQNVWNIAQGTPVATRIKVDVTGNITLPSTVYGPNGAIYCPSMSGDTCAWQGPNTWNPSPYTYSDFTGFGLRNFTHPKGAYRYVVAGCANAGAKGTKWIAVQWDGDVPLGTALSLRARAGNTAMPDATWGAWTSAFNASPADLLSGMALVPNLSSDAYLQVEFDFSTTIDNATPKLKSFDVLYECPI
jgi:hypothetical protein